MVNYNYYLKRILGFIIALLCCILFLPLLVVVSIWIKIDSKGPVLFKQTRIGAGEKEFTIYKFRSMYTDTPKDMPTHLLDNPDAMITRAGRILRKTSIDELPQLFNILRGDMSIVGPRPALWNQFDLIDERRKYTRGTINVNDLRPGLTGWAQINGRDELPIPLKAELDGEYLKKISFLFDVECIIKTVKVVLTHEGFVEGSQDRSSEKE